MSLDDHLEFRLLKYFLAVVEAGSFTAAATRLYVSQSTISTQIGKLEDILNVQLFDREHGYKLTAQGQTHAVLRGVIVEEERRIRSNITGDSRSNPRAVAIRVSPFVQKGALHSVSELYKELMPDCEMMPESGDTEEILERLRAGKLDAAPAYTASSRRGL